MASREKPGKETHEAEEHMRHFHESYADFSSQLDSKVKYRDGIAEEVRQKVQIVNAAVSCVIAAVILFLGIKLRSTVVQERNFSEIENVLYILYLAFVAMVTNCSVGFHLMYSSLKGNDFHASVIELELTLDDLFKDLTRVDTNIVNHSSEVAQELVDSGGASDFIHCLKSSGPQSKGLEPSKLEEHMDVMLKTVLKGVFQETFNPPGVEPALADSTDNRPKNVTFQRSSN